MPRMTYKKFWIGRLGKEQAIQQVVQVFRPGDYIRLERSHTSWSGNSRYYTTYGCVEEVMRNGQVKYQSSDHGPGRVFDRLSDALGAVLRGVDQGRYVLCMRNP